MERDKFKCVCCESETATLNVHHSYYCKSRNPWEYPDFALTTLCEDCHKRRHEDGRIEGDETEEWEQVIDWLFGGTVQEAGVAWWGSIAVNLAISKGVSRKEIWDSIRKHISENFAVQLP